MRDEEYYKAIAKVAEDWRRQNAVALQEIAHVANTIQPISIRMLKDLESSMVDFGTMQEQISTITASIRPIESALGENIRAANLQMSKVLMSLKPYQHIAQQLQKDQCRWAESLRASTGALSQLTGIAAALRRDFSLTARSALLAQQLVVRIDPEAVGKAANVTHQAQATLHQALIEMAGSYRHLWDMFHTDPQRLFSVPPVVTKAPSLEMYLAVYQAEVSTIEVKVLPDDEEFLTEIEPSVQHMVDAIASIDVQLLPMYQGAIDAITSNNVDHVRHATTSLRELFTQILHKLAPDEAFFKWNQDELNLYNGRPTRKGRLLYICRNINCDPFKTFVDQDILAALVFLDLVQKGTHAKKKPFNERQLKALLIRMESLLDFIIRTSRDV
jgi:hypothetical protein